MRSCSVTKNGGLADARSKEELEDNDKRAPMPCQGSFAFSTAAAFLEAIASARSHQQHSRVRAVRLAQALQDSKRIPR